MGVGQGEKPGIPAGKGFVGLGKTEERRGERGSCALTGIPEDGEAGGGFQRGWRRNPEGLEGLEWGGWKGIPERGFLRKERPDEDFRTGIPVDRESGGEFLWVEGLQWAPAAGDPRWEDPEGRIPEDGGAGEGIPRTESPGGIPEGGSLGTEGPEGKSWSGNSCEWRDRRGWRRVWDS